jgi:hypothetical protein
MKWRKVFLTREQILDGTQMQIVFQATRIFKKAGTPADTALFISNVPNKDHGVEMYFSPKAAALSTDLIDKHGGVACDPPAAENVSLSAGRHRFFDPLK